MGGSYEEKHTSFDLNFLSSKYILTKGTIRMYIDTNSHKAAILLNQYISITLLVRASGLPDVSKHCVCGRLTPLIMHCHARQEDM